MKRIFSILLIALLLLCPLLTSHADDEGYIIAPEDMLGAEDDAALEARVAEIVDERGVAMYFVYTEEDNGGAELIRQTKAFAESVPDDNAVVLAVNPSLYYIQTKGILAEAVFPDSVCDAVLWEAFRSVKGDNAGKVLAYLNAADETLASFDGFVPEPTAAPAEETLPEDTDYLTGVALTDGGLPTVVDLEGLLTLEQREALSQRLQAIGRKYRCDVVVVTVDSLGYKTAEEYADDFFDHIGYGYGATPDENGGTVNGDGILLLLSMEARDFAVSTSGYGITAFTDYGIQVYLEPLFLPYLKVNDYNAGFNAFADGCETLLDAARRGEPLDVFTVTEQTANGKPVLMDMAALLTVEQVQTLSRRLKAIGDKYQCDVIFVTDADYRYDGDSAAERYYTENGYGYRVTGANGSTENHGGILFFYSSRSGKLSQYVDGDANKAFKGRGLNRFRQEMLSALYRDDFGGVVETYAAQAEKYLAAASSGRAINPINWFPVLLAIGVGLLFGFIPVGAMKRQLTDVRSKTGAEEYMTSSSFVLTQNSDVLLNTSVSRSVHVTQSSSGGGSGRSGGGFGGFHGGSSTHTSSSGGFHGGHSGKF